MSSLKQDTNASEGLKRSAGDSFFRLGERRCGVVALPGMIGGLMVVQVGFLSSFEQEEK